MTFWQKVDHMLEDKLGDMYTNEPNHFNIQHPMGLKIDWQCDENGNSMFDMKTPFGFSESWKWDNENMTWELDVEQSEQYKFSQSWESQVMGFKPKRNGNLKQNNNLVQGSVIKGMDAIEMKLKMGDNTWKFEQQMEGTVEVTAEEVPEIMTLENGSLDKNALMEAGVEHRMLSWSMHQKQSCMDTEFEMSLVNSVSYENEDMPFTSGQTTMEMQSSWIDENGDEMKYKQAYINGMEMTKFEMSEEQDTFEMAAVITQHMGKSLKKADTKSFHMDFSMKMNGASTCHAMMSMMMEGVEMADMPDCIVEMHMDNMFYLNWETMEPENLEDFAIYEVVSPSNQDNFYSMVHTYGGAPVAGVQCNMQEMTISGILGENYEELVTINYEQMMTAHWETKYFFMFMFHVQMKVNEMFGEWMMSEEFDMNMMKDGMFYYDKEFELKGQETINTINMMRDAKCGMTVDEYYLHMGFDFKNSMDAMVKAYLSKEVLFMMTYERELMEMNMFSWEAHMKVMEMWNAFEYVPLSDADLNVFAEQFCNKYHDHMVDWHQMQIDSVNEWFTGMRQWHKNMADEIYDRLARQDEINAAQVEYFNMVKNMAETEWKCEFDYWLEQSQGWPMGSVQDYSNCGNWEVPQIEA